MHVLSNRACADGWKFWNCPMASPQMRIFLEWGDFSTWRVKRCQSSVQVELNERSEKPSTFPHYVVNKAGTKYPKTMLWSIDRCISQYEAQSQSSPAPTRAFAPRLSVTQVARIRRDTQLAHSWQLALWRPAWQYERTKDGGGSQNYKSLPIPHIMD